MNRTMNGAQSIVQTLVDSGVDTCFANPGTSEMHFMAALDEVPGLRGVLCLFEGVATGAADGYGRMADKPAATLLHLGPGLANGAANIHNARRARSPMVNIVGDHATYHKAYDAPLTSDVEGIAKPFSDWLRVAQDASGAAADAAAAVQAARSAGGKIASLILPADAAWSACEGSAVPLAPHAPTAVATERIREAAAMLRSDAPTAILMTGQALRHESLLVAGRIAQATGATLLAQTANGRIERGAGRVAVQRIPYAVDAALAFLKPYRNVILVGAKAPVAFFAYPGKPSVLTAEPCQVFTLASPDQDGPAALQALDDELGTRHVRLNLVQAPAPSQASAMTDMLTPTTLAAIVSELMPEHSIVVDESITIGRDFFRLTNAASPHDWLQITGGAIGCAIPIACGAALACPGRKVITLEGDGSAMYTVQGLWTQARENLDVVTIILNNRAYGTLATELVNVGVPVAGPKAIDMIQLQRPCIDWMAAARTFGVMGLRAQSATEFRRHLLVALRERGPVLLEAVC